VLVPDHTPMGNNLLHQITLVDEPPHQLGTTKPHESLARLLMRSTLMPTLTPHATGYWNEITPIQKKWGRLTNQICPMCGIKTKSRMDRHIRLTHTTFACHWRCPVVDCPTWFAFELNAANHLVRCHGFIQGRGWSCYNILRSYGIE
jgi:hypothetical protein